MGNKKYNEKKIRFWTLNIKKYLLILRFVILDLFGVK